MKCSNKDFRGKFIDSTLVDEAKALIAAGEKSPQIWYPVRGVRDDLKDIFSTLGFVLIPTVPSSTVLKKKSVSGNCYIKIYHPIGLLNQFKERLLPKALRTFKKTFIFMHLGLKTPKPLGWCYIKRQYKSILFTEETSGGSLYDIFIRNCHQKQLPVSIPGRKDILINVANEVAAAHKKGVFFKDFHLGHIYLNKKGMEFIDLDGIRFKRKLDEKAMARDISGLNNPSLPLSVKERLFFLSSYIEAIERQDINKKRLLHLIKQYSLKRYKTWKA